MPWMWQNNLLIFNKSRKFIFKKIFVHWDIFKLIYNFLNIAIMIILWSISDHSKYLKFFWVISAVLFLLGLSMLSSPFPCLDNSDWAHYYYENLSLNILGSLGKNYLLLGIVYVYFLKFYGHTHGTGVQSKQQLDLRYSCSNATSLTYRTRMGMKPMPPQQPELL